MLIDNADPGEDADGLTYMYWEDGAETEVTVIRKPGIVFGKMADPDFSDHGENISPVLVAGGWDWLDRMVGSSWLWSRFDGI